MLVERHASETYRLAAAIVGPADAADVAQESFVSAWQQLPKLRSADAFGPWLRRICVNRSRNWLRDRGRRPRAVIDLDALESGAPPRVAGDFRSAAEARVVLEPAFEALTLEQRSLLALHYSLGLSLAETAAALALPVGTAKSRLNAALAAMRRELADPLRPVDTDDISSEAAP